MRWIRAAVLASLAFKVMVLGVWWWASVARAERAAKPAAAEVPSAAAESSGAGVSPELFAKSRGFRDLLEAVRQRGAELDRREQTVAAREAALKTLEQTLGAEVARLEGVGAPRGGVGGEAAAGVAGERGGACSVAVTKVYQSMKAEEAAPILDRLDDATVKGIFGCMKEKQIGAILAVMSRDRAAALTRALAGAPEAVAVR